MLAKSDRRQQGRAQHRRASRGGECRSARRRSIAVLGGVPPRVRSLVVLPSKVALLKRKSHEHRFVRSASESRVARSVSSRRRRGSSPSPGRARTQSIVYVVDDSQSIGDERPLARRTSTSTSAHGASRRSEKVGVVAFGGHAEVIAPVGAQSAPEVKPSPEAGATDDLAARDPPRRRGAPRRGPSQHRDPERSPPDARRRGGRSSQGGRGRHPRRRRAARRPEADRSRSSPRSSRGRRTWRSISRSASTSTSSATFRTRSRGRATASMPPVRLSTAAHTRTMPSSPRTSRRRSSSSIATRRRASTSTRRTPRRSRLRLGPLRGRARRTGRRQGEAASAR